MNRHLVMPGLMARMTPEQVRLLFRRQVFKFYHAKDSHSVIDQATVRIGTLQGYRKIENPALRDDRDDSEGVSSSRPSRGLFFQGGGKSPDPELHPQSLMTRVGAQWASRFDVVIGGSFEFAELFDFYVYCFSYECSVSVAKSFNPPFDSVARIDDVFAFAEMISQHHPELRGYSYVIGPVVYRKRPRDFDEANPPYPEQAFEKPVEFEGNKEGRIVFIRPDRETDALLCPVPDFPHPAILRRLIWPYEMPK